MSQVTVITTTTSPLVTVLHFRASLINVTVTMAPTTVAKQQWVSMMWFCHHRWLQGTQWGVVLASLLCCSNILNPRILLRHMPNVPWVLHRWVFSFRVEHPTDSYVMSWCVLWCLLSYLRGLNHWGLQHHHPSEYAYGRHMYPLLLVCGLHQEYTEWLLLPLPEEG